MDLSGKHTTVEATILHVPSRITRTRKVLLIEGYSTEADITNIIALHEGLTMEDLELVSVTYPKED